MTCDATQDEQIREHVDHIDRFRIRRKHFVSEFQLRLLEFSDGGWRVQGQHFDKSVILLCVQWYLAYNLSLQNLEEMMAERGISVDHATVHRWVVRYSPELLKRFNSRKRAVTRKWHVDETYIKVRGRWTYLYRAIDSNGDTVEFWFSEAT